MDSIRKNEDNNYNDNLVADSVGRTKRKKRKEIETTIVFIKYMLCTLNKHILFCVAPRFEIMEFKIRYGLDILRQC